MKNQNLSILYDMINKKEKNNEIYAWFLKYGTTHIGNESFAC